MKLEELFESLTSVYPYYKINDDETYEFSCEFFANDDKSKNDLISVDCTYDPDDKEWEISFARRPTPDSKWTFDVSNGGNQFKIFATVISFIKKFVSQRDPNIISFTAKSNEASRVKLYKTLVKKLATDYDVETEEVRRMSAQLTKFKLVKK